MKKITASTNKSLDKDKTDGSQSTKNLWNLFDCQAVNTIDTLIEMFDYSQFNYCILERLIICFRDGIKPSDVIQKDDTQEDFLNAINNLSYENIYDEYGISEVYYCIENLDLPKPNGWRLAKNKRNEIVLLMTNGSTYKHYTLYNHLTEPFILMTQLEIKKFNKDVLDLMRTLQVSINYGIEQDKIDEIKHNIKLITDITDKEVSE